MDKEIKSLLELINNDEALIASSERCVREARHLNVSGLCEQQKGYLVAALAYKICPKACRHLVGYGKSQGIG